MTSITETSSPRLVAVLAVFCAVVASCSARITETQDIEIAHFADTEKNRRLAEELIYYDPAYLAHRMPAFDEDTSKGMQLAYHVGSSDGRPMIRITYNRSIDAVADNLDELKRQFEAFIPELAAEHAARETLFRELEPVGLSWAETFFSEDAETVLEISSRLLRDTVTAEQVAKLQDELAASHGQAANIEYVRAQFYEAFGAVPESVSLFYETRMTSDSAFMLRVSLHETDGEWRTIGFSFGKTR